MFLIVEYDQRFPHPANMLLYSNILITTDNQQLSYFLHLDYTNNVFLSTLVSLFISIYHLFCSVVLIYVRIFYSYRISIFSVIVILLLLLAQVTYNQVQPLRINYLQLVHGHLVSTQIRTIGLNCFKVIIELIVPSTKIV